MRRRTYSQTKRKLKKILRSSLCLLKATSKTIAMIFRSLAEYILLEAIFWVMTLGGIASLFIAFGMPQNIASILAIAISFGLFILALYILWKFEREKKQTRNKRESEIRLAVHISRTFANGTSTQWSEYQDWLHDILLARRQLLDAKCPQWKVKLITYHRLSVFCLVVGISKIKQVVRIKRSR